MLAVGVLSGLITYWAARSWTQQMEEGHLPLSLSSEAASLKYTSESAFRSDQRKADTALADVLLRAPGAQETWENVETGNSGLVWSAHERARPDGAVCRDVERRAHINHSFREATAIVCRSPGEPWSGSIAWQQR